MYFKTYIKLKIHKQITTTDWMIRSISEGVFGTILEKHKDIVLVTGGCSGLGNEIVKRLVKRNVQKIIVFDLNLPKDEIRLPSVSYFKCDVGDFSQVEQLAHQIRNEIGVITIVINNAGITSGKTLLELSVDEIDKIIKVNLLSNFYVNKVFLPDMIQLKRGYIVTISSVLGYMAPSRLTAYGASKSGLIGFHESLTYELGPPLFSSTGVKTLLVCPGQLKTCLFNGVKTPSNILAPPLEPSYVAQKIVKAIECGKRGEIQLPVYGNFLPLFRNIPWPITQITRLVSGMDESMKTYNP